MCGASYMVGILFLLAGIQQPFQNIYRPRWGTILKACLGQRKKFSLAIGILVERIGRNNASAQKIHHIQPYEFGGKMEQTNINHSRWKDFRVPMGQDKAFQAAQLRGLKVRFLLPRRKPLVLKPQNT
jgi:hypothetical protein